MTQEPLLAVRPDLREEALDGDVVVLEPSTGMLHVLSGSGAAAWSALRRGCTRTALIDEVTGLYDVRQDEAAIAELVRFVDDLTRRGLVTVA